MTLLQIVGVAVPYAVFVVLCGVATYKMVLDELRAIDDEDPDE